MVDVFISYSRRDQAKVAMLARASADEGYDIWWDAELPPHRSYGDVITDKIASAKAALVVWSIDSAQSEWVRAEADMARNQKKLIQTAIDDVTPPLPFNQIQYAEIGDWQGEADHIGWRKVKYSLAELCGERSGGEQADRGGGRAPAPVPTPTYQQPPTNPAASPGSKWPLFVGLGVAGVALIAAGVFAGGLLETETVEPAPATAQANPDAVERSAVTGDEAGQERSSSRFTLLATVADPDGYSNLRDAPSVSGRIVGRVQVGQAFATYDQSGKWWQVRLPDGTIGFIARSRIRLSGESDAAAASGDARAPDPSDMIFPDSSERLLDPSDIDQFGPSNLQFARNEIYARKGRRFKDPRLREYFGRFSWYRPLHDEVALNSIETQNVATIRAAEAHFQ